MIELLKWALDYVATIFKDAAEAVLKEAIQVTVLGILDAFDGTPGLTADTRLKAQGVILDALVEAQLIKGVDSKDVPE